MYVCMYMYMYIYTYIHFPAPPRDYTMIWYGIA